MAGSVGFIGLGNMGGPMALNLAKAGFELVVHDINPARLDPLVAAGATVEASPEAVAGRCHRTICMVETTEPGTGEIGWDYVFRRIEELGYAGWIGCEYTPLGDTAEGLAWRRRYGV